MKDLHPRNCPAALEMLALPKFGAGIGLHRMRWALEQLPDRAWLENLDAIKVTGSKGKGSTASICAAILRQLGFTTGLYTSPHLYRFNERIKTGQRDILDEELAIAWEWFKAVKMDYERLHPNDSFGAFEACTAVAARHFANQRVEALVVESGIGGRYDPARTIPGRTAALTSVELEHVNLLGDRTELIAYDKADLCPPHGTLLAGNTSAVLLHMPWLPVSLIGESMLWMAALLTLAFTLSVSMAPEASVWSQGKKSGNFGYVKYELFRCLTRFVSYGGLVSNLVWFGRIPAFGVSVGLV